MIVLAHLSDPHLSPLPRPRLSELAGKRALGLLNWRLRRHREHRAEVLDAIVRDLVAQAPDQIAVTGDLVNIALPDEFTAGRAFLARLGPPDRVTFVPGNHDAYVDAAAAHRAQYWTDYMGGDLGVGAATDFPFVRRRGHVALIGLSTAVPTGPFMAWGILGAEQLARLSETLERLAAEKMFRIILMHHSPLPRATNQKRDLRDDEEFLAVLRRCGADLVLHGHYHRRSLELREGPRNPIPIVGVPSASAIGWHDERAGYNLYSIDENGGQWRCEMISRGLAADGAVSETERRVIVPAPG